ncbi:DUF2167 domain-containing protein [Lysobacter sp. S4-A87]|uniref:DUF2167 domain-containing protein n=1 Tax=Lysobacter sp. S4-A87 TaxID=2925843 RepID=UPI001F53CCFF|nr:DUF2167 domain-containing protein [Lysobacter sp. S4-A87]UNK48582.1 DUF2167 domain-containing protein [Lysobacter sp. S4-A87]
MRKHLFSVLGAIALTLAHGLMPAMAQDSGGDSGGDSDISSLPWQVGPAKGVIADKAVIDVPKGYAFLGAEGTRKLNEMMHNPSGEGDEYTLAPKDLSWFSFFSFDDVGYVKDDEKLEPDDILASIKEGTEESNVERRQRGWETMHIEGWSFKPQYDKNLQLLEWAILAEVQPSRNKVVNYNTRLLGRHGVMEVVLVANPEGLDAAIADFKGLVPGYSFNAGEKYAEFRAGDHVAEYGLAALITGGAAAVASKKGFFAAIALFLAKAWKLVLLAVAGGWAAFRKFLGKKDGASE